MEDAWMHQATNCISHELLTHTMNAQSQLNMCVINQRPHAREWTSSCICWRKSLCHSLGFEVRAVK